MEVAQELNVLFNLLQAALLAYATRTLAHLRREIRLTAVEVREDLVAQRREDGA